MSKSQRAAFLVEQLAELFESPVTSITTVKHGEISFAPPQDDEPAVVGDPLKPVTYPEITEYARKRGVLGPGPIGFAARFWVLGVNEHMDEQVRKNSQLGRSTILASVMQEDFAFAERYDADGGSEYDYSIQVYIGAAEPGSPQFINQAIAEIDDAAAWKERREKASTADGLPHWDDRLEG